MRSLVIVSLFIATVAAHSWLACSDYRIGSKADEITYNAANCKGFPRSWKDSNPGGAFGTDTGYDFATSAPGCEQAFSNPLSNAYSAQWPMAQYAPGQNVCMAWPAKNHVAATCNNPNIPDNGLSIWITPVNPSANPNPSTLRLVKAFPKTPRAAANGQDPSLGFQYCPTFCTNPDKATCTGCFTVPTDLAAGAYTFVWSWAFNGPTQIYSNCFDAQVSGTAVPTDAPTPNPTITATGQCLQQCQALCGEKTITVCDCTNGFNAACADASSSSTLMISTLSLVALAFF